MALNTPLFAIESSTAVPRAGPPEPPFVIVACGLVVRLTVSAPVALNVTVDITLPVIVENVRVEKPAVV